MPSPNVLEFDALLAPIEGDNPGGADLREDPSPTSKYFAIKDARSAARAAERGADVEQEQGGLLPEWRRILELAPEVLATQSKDLEIAAWLTEALLRAHGYVGLRDGFKLMRGLVENFWDNLYPKPDDGIADRVAPITGLNGEGADGTLIQPMREVEITEGRDPGPFAYWQYEQAAELLKLGDEEKVRARVEAGAITMEQFEASVRQSTPGFYLALVADLNEALEEWLKLSAELDAKAGSDSPPSSTVRNALRAIVECVQSVAKDILAVAEGAESAAQAAEAGGDSGAGAARVGGVSVATGAIATREDALKTLLKVAEFFRKTEPQSPIPLVLEEAVRRARLPLHELLAELITDGEARRQFFLYAGIKPPPEESE
jgi:type VI secretion system protein ImpA